jgi:hypothetical protein
VRSTFLLWFWIFLRFCHISYRFPRELVNMKRNKLEMSVQSLLTPLDRKSSSCWDNRTRSLDSTSDRSLLLRFLASLKRCPFGNTADVRLGQRGSLDINSRSSSQDLILLAPVQRDFFHNVVILASITPLLEP